VALEEHVAAHGELPDPHGEDTPERQLQRSETVGRVWDALNELPFDQRAAIVLREIDGLSYEEISVSIGVAVGTVKSRLARARQTLRVTLRKP
jgi:RNA polymerase sigma-70 factor (ECF subfamily)